MITLKQENRDISIEISAMRRYDSVLANRIGATKPRRAQKYEMSYYLSGNGGSININGVEYPIDAGYFRFVRPGDIVFSTPHFACLTVIFNISGSDGIAVEELFGAIPPFQKIGDEFQNLFEKAIEAYANKNAEGYLLQNSYLLRILLKLCHSESLNSYPPNIDNCIKYMQDNFSSHITLAELGERAGYSALHLRRIFEATTGMSPHKYLTYIRIEHAKVLLETQDISIDMIAEQCGFHSTSHFKMIFKEYTSKTPGRYRKDMREY